MTPVIDWLETIVGTIPLPLLEVWGRFSYLIGLLLAICAFGGFTFRIGDQWGFGRERQKWDSKAFLSIPLTFVLVIVAGYLGSFEVLVEGAQTFESLKDLVVLVTIVLFGYPALIAVPPAYMLSDLIIEGVRPDFVLSWAEGYFFWTAFVWIAYQLIGRNPDFRLAQTWRRYALFVGLIMLLDPVMWGFICSGPKEFPPRVFVPEHLVGTLLHAGRHVAGGARRLSGRPATRPPVRMVLGGEPRARQRTHARESRLDLGVRRRQARAGRRDSVRPADPDLPVHAVHRAAARHGGRHRGRGAAQRQ